jgi:hypothetical protein
MGVFGWNRRPLLPEMSWLVALVLVCEWQPMVCHAEERDKSAQAHDLQAKCERYREEHFRCGEMALT